MCYRSLSTCPWPRSIILKWLSHKTGESCRWFVHKIQQLLFSNPIFKIAVWNKDFTMENPFRYCETIPLTGSAAPSGLSAITGLMRTKLCSSPMSCGALLAPWFTCQGGVWALKQHMGTRPYCTVGWIDLALFCDFWSATHFCRSGILFMSPNPKNRQIRPHKRQSFYC